MRFKTQPNKKGVYKGYSSLLLGLQYSLKISVLCFAIFTATAQPAYCYIDPGSGSMIWQLIVSAFIGMSFYFRKSIASIFSKVKKSDNNNETSYEEK